MHDGQVLLVLHLQLQKISDPPPSLLCEVKPSQVCSSTASSPGQPFPAPLPLQPLQLCFPPLQPRLGLGPPCCCRGLFSGEEPAGRKFPLPFHCGVGKGVNQTGCYLTSSSPWTALRHACLLPAPACLLAKFAFVPSQFSLSPLYSHWGGAEGLARAAPGGQDLSLPPLGAQRPPVPDRGRQGALLPLPQGRFGDSGALL